MHKVTHNKPHMDKRHPHTQQTRAVIFDICVKYGLSEYLKNEEIELRKAFNAKFKGNSLLKFMKIYFSFV